MKSFWVSWYATEDNGAFEIHSPWWFTGVRCSDNADTVCAAVRAEDEDAAREVIYSSYDKRPGDIEFRFVEERPDEWSPFNDRFLRADWMQWEQAA